jgi:hypothetical protein
VLFQSIKSSKKTKEKHGENIKKAKS